MLRFAAFIFSHRVRGALKWKNGIHRTATDGGREILKGFKKNETKRDEPGINNLVSTCQAEEGRASERCLRMADRILPSCEATRRREGPPRVVVVGGHLADDPLPVRVAVGGGGGGVGKCAQATWFSVPQLLMPTSETERG